MLSILHSPLIPVVTFRAAGMPFAVAKDDLVQVLRQPRLTRVPGAASAFDWVLGHRGRMVPVLDLARRLGHEPAGEVVLLVRSAGDVVGVRADALEAEAEWAGTDGLASVGAAGVVAGVPTALLDAAALAATEPVAVLSEAGRGVNGA